MILHTDELINLKINEITILLSIGILLHYVPRIN